MNKVRVGFFSFTEITDPNEHHSYNEWHQLDHMPEQFPLDGIAFGQRWVSTPACRAARAVSGPLLDPIHYVTLYLMTEPVDRTLREFMQLGRDLHEAGRFHFHRRALLSGPFAFTDAAAASRVLISADAVPYRPNRGVRIVVQEADGESPDLLAECAVPGVAGAWMFDDERYRITVSWLDDEPLDVVTRVPPPPPQTLFDGGFESVTPWQWDWFD